jgi:hypothetical protein
MPGDTAATEASAGRGDGNIDQPSYMMIHRYISPDLPQ